MRRPVHALLASLLVGLPVLLPPSASAATRLPGGVEAAALGPLPAGPVVARGILRDPRGRAAAGRVAAFRLPSEDEYRAIRDGEPITLSMVGWGRSGDDGHYALRLDPTRSRGAGIAAGEPLDLRIVAWDGSHAAVGVASVRPNTGSPIALASLSGASGALAPARADLRLASADLEPSGVGGLLLWPYPFGCWWTRHGSDRVAVLDAQQFPYRSRWSISLGADHAISLGYALSAGASFADFRSAGSLVRRQGLTLDYAWSRAPLSTYVEMVYGRWQESCGLLGVVLASHWEYRPEYPTGGTTQLPASNPPPCNHQAVIRAKVIWSRASSTGRATSYRAGVAASRFIGIDLGFTSTYERAGETRRDIRIDVASPPVRLCGDNDYPSVASRIREIAP